MQKNTKENDYKEICNYIEMYDKCYVDVWWGFSACDNIYRKQMALSSANDIKQNRQAKLDSLVKEFKMFINNFL